MSFVDGVLCGVGDGSGIEHVCWLTLFWGGFTSGGAGTWPVLCQWAVWFRPCNLMGWGKGGLPKTGSEMVPFLSHSPRRELLVCPACGHCHQWNHDVSAAAEFVLLHQQPYHQWYPSITTEEWEVFPKSFFYLFCKAVDVWWAQHYKPKEEAGMILPPRPRSRCDSSGKETYRLNSQNPALCRPSSEFLSPWVQAASE